MICELFPEGDFYIACKIKSSSERLEGKAVNNHKISPKQTFEKMGKTSESPAQKAVLVNCLACYLLRSSDISFGEIWDISVCFCYNPVYFGKINNPSLTVEQRLSVNIKIRLYIWHAK